MAINQATIQRVRKFFDANPADPMLGIEPRANRKAMILGLEIALHSQKKSQTAGSDFRNQKPMADAGDVAVGQAHSIEDKLRIVVANECSINQIPAITFELSQMNRWAHEKVLRHVPPQIEYLRTHSFEEWVDLIKSSVFF